MLNLKIELFHLSYQHWLNYEFLTWRWFVKILIIIIFTFVIFKFIDRKRIFEIISYGVLISLISVILDIIGTYLVFWEYTTRVFPIEFSEIHDLVVIPVSFMLVYQYFDKWNSFIFASAILSAMASFAFEPIFIMLKFYNPITWKHVYSFPIFWLVAIICRYLIKKLKPI